MYNRAFLDVIIEPELIPMAGWGWVVWVLLTLAIVTAAFWLIRRVLLGRRARETEQRRRDEEDRL